MCNKQVNQKINFRWLPQELNSCLHISCIYSLDSVRVSISGLLDCLLPMAGVGCGVCVFRSDFPLLWISFPCLTVLFIFVHVFRLVSASVVASHACWLVKPVCLSVVAAFFWRSLWFGSSCFFFALMYCDISGEEQEDLPLARKIGDWTGPATRDIGANWEMGIWICAIGQAWRRKQDMACVANQPHSQVCPPGAYRDIVYRGVQRFLGGEGLLCLHFYRLLSGGHVCIHHSPRTCHLQITAIAPTPTPSLATTTRKNSTGEYEEDATTAVATSMAVSVCERDDRT